MRKSLLVLGIFLMIVGIFIFYYSSERNCILGLLMSGRLTPWTVVEIGGGVLAIIGFFVTLLGVVKKSSK